MQLMAGICKWNKDWRTDADATSVGHFTVPVIDRMSLLRHLGRVTSGDRCPNPALLIQTDLQFLFKSHSIVGLGYDSAIGGRGWGRMQICKSDRRIFLGGEPFRWICGRYCSWDGRLLQPVTITGGVRQTNPQWREVNIISSEWVAIIPVQHLIQIQLQAGKQACLVSAAYTENIQVCSIQCLSVTTNDFPPKEK